MKLRQFLFSFVLLLIVYMLALGPLCWLHARYPRTAEFPQAIDLAYGSMLRRLGDDAPDAATGAVRWYTQLWAPNVDVFRLSQPAPKFQVGYPAPSRY